MFFVRLLSLLLLLLLFNETFRTGSQIFRFANFVGSNNFVEHTLGVINFRDISGAVLERVVQYFYYKVKYTNATGDIPRFAIEPEYALELLMVSCCLLSRLPSLSMNKKITNILGLFSYITISTKKKGCQLS